MNKYNNVFLTVIIIILFIMFSFSYTGAEAQNYGVYYEIFVRSFYDSDGDGIGDLRGVAEKLDYLNDGDPLTKNDLGIKGIWLMPILKSSSYHGYDVTDYYQINPDYGDLEDLHYLIKEAHKRGIKVIMDLPINHTGINHIWFRMALSNPESKYRNYYIWADKYTNLDQRREDGSRVWHNIGQDYYYAYFWKGMPDLNYNNSDLKEEIINIGEYWLRQGLDGYRLDGAKHIFPPREYEKNFIWWDEFNSEMEAIKPVYLVGEIWDKPDIIAPYLKKGFDSAFNFSIGVSIIKTLQSGFTFNIKNNLPEIYDNYNEIVGRENYIDAPFLTNHDQNRIIDQLDFKREKARVAASIYLTLPGNPFIYYGEEIGMKGSKPDINIREPMQWFEGKGTGETSWQDGKLNDGYTSVESEEEDNKSLLNHYRKLIHFRNSKPVFYSGHIEFLNTGSKVIGYKRYDNEENLYVYHNIGKFEKEVRVKKGTVWKVVFSTFEVNVPVSNNGWLKFKLPPYSSLILQRK